MNTDRELMKQALEALNHVNVQDRVQVITALRERLAQPEQEPKCGVIIEVFGKDWRLEYMSLPVGKHKLYTQQYIYTAPQPQMQPCAGRNCGSTNPNLHSAECFEDYEKATGMSSVEHAVIAGALFDFMGWLTSRKERIVLSSADNASTAVDAIRDFAKMRGLSLDDAKVQDWQDIARVSNAP